LISSFPFAPESPSSQAKSAEQDVRDELLKIMSNLEGMIATYAKTQAALSQLTILLDAILSMKDSLNRMSSDLARISSMLIPTPATNAVGQPLVLPVNQERILKLLRSTEHAGQGLQLSHIAHEVHLPQAHTRCVLLPLCSSGLVRISHCGGKYEAVRNGSRTQSLAAGTAASASSTTPERSNATEVPIEKKETSSLPAAPPPYPVRALYDFKEDDDGRCLAFKKNDSILITQRNASGWCLGLHRESGRLGWLPANYVEMVTTSEPSSAADTVTELPAAIRPAANDTRRLICKMVIREQLYSVLRDKLSVLLLPLEPLTSDEIKRLQRLILTPLIDGNDRSLVCFSGICMRAKQHIDAISFSQLDGSGIDKFKKLYEKADKAFRQEFESGYLFHGLIAREDQRDEVFHERWKLLGVKEEQNEQLGICGACRVCRQGFASWDEKWLADDGAEDEDDE
jgi:hypothetical protein